mmetsp:Transcript_6801/g.9930  ORF Transcript_6801/g.9930 Transcript_6801/m.9930 type:complete len:476 (-) Transcript_6801:125-1552(-)|eukprot:CAMPEP_0194207142 /NCGR_PEP_ID=MMETSP0156-20130528/5983_1 /TAXON_ID=33649 /ORGANISM="Thalassionema nitzschioides, Strain L26-B" /LENGTH=475 /DNA_ID=CAMNT_0038933847 /DNA_START=44 /DNA_END=1471 /DNA_ORIENTATION=-
MRAFNSIIYRTCGSMNQFQRFKKARLWQHAQRLWLTTSSRIVIEERPLEKQRPSKIYLWEGKNRTWNVTSADSIDKKESSSSRMNTIEQSMLHRYVINHFLPANYPKSVADGYGRFASYCFIASVAGSASMVLSTQTLLLAIGVFGQQTSASIMAGALNWVLKDGIGQLGGIGFASFMGRSTSQFDANPKYWRMVAALSLDAATLLEITSPLVPSNLVLPIASVANIGKNIGFLTASASRAALHQALAKTGNLGDVTAKAGSQSMAASLFGTALGIGMTPLLADVPHFIMGYVFLSLAHQTFNFLSLKAVPLAHFNFERLDLVLKAYILSERKVLSPADVAAEEMFFSLTPRFNNKTEKWLKIGGSVQMLGGPEACKKMLFSGNIVKPYVLVRNNNIYHLGFVTEATSSQVIQGMYHAYCLHYKKIDQFCDGEKEDEALERFNKFALCLTEKGWDLTAIRIEPTDAVRLSVSKKD